MSNDQTFDSEDYLTNLRRITMDQLAVYERQLGMSPTTSEKLYWMKIKGPQDSVLLRQVRHAKSCEQERVQYREGRTIEN